MKKIKIGFKPYEYECGDHCCYETGSDIYVDDKEIGSNTFDTPDHLLKMVLEHLGYEVEMEWLDDDLI